MTTQTRINELKLQLENAKTFTPEGRQTVANLCKELYNSIEEDVYNAGSEWMLKGMYNELCEGNFSEPFMCEQKKNTFNVVVHIYETIIVPNI